MPEVPRTITSMTSVEQARIAEAKRKREQRQRDRAAFAQARRHGLAARKRAKLARIPLPREGDQPAPDAPPPAA